MAHGKHHQRSHRRSSITSNSRVSEITAGLLAEAVKVQLGKEIHWHEFHTQMSPQRCRASGQTDFAFYFTGDERVALLVENTIFSPFTFEQAERYHLECEALMRSGVYNVAIPILFCPSEYRRRAGRLAMRFPVWVSYENLKDRLSGEEEEGRGYLQQAIERCVRGWIAEEVPAVTNNFEGYRWLLSRMGPSIRMITGTANKPRQSRTVRFQLELLGSSSREFGITILHQWQECRAKILFDGWANLLQGKALASRMATETSRFGLKLDKNETGSLGLYVATPQSTIWANGTHRLKLPPLGLER